MKLSRFYLPLCLGVLVCAACSNGTDPDPTTYPPPTALELALPPEFPDPLIPVDNPTTVEGVRLGRMLFYDPILSADSSQACGACHIQEFSFADSLRFSRGVAPGHPEGDRQAPAIINPMWLPAAFWDGRQPTLEAQAGEPVPNPIEMNLPWSQATARLQRHADYPTLFGQAFGTDVITMDLAVKAIAQFERTMISVDSKFDRVNRGLEQFTAEQDSGFVQFFTEKADCFHCHGPKLGTTHRFNNIGLDSVYTGGVDRGRILVTGNQEDLGKFKVPTLRNIALTAPYMHDGRFNTLEEVINHYNTGGHDPTNQDPLVRFGTGLGLSPQDVQYVIAFLNTLTDTAYVNNPDLSNPFDS